MTDNFSELFHVVFVFFSISFIFDTHTYREGEITGDTGGRRAASASVAAWMPIIWSPVLAVCIHTPFGYSTYAGAISRWLSCSWRGVISGPDHGERAIMRSRQCAALLGEHGFREISIPPLSLSLFHFFFLSESCCLSPFLSLSGYIGYILLVRNYREGGLPDRYLGNARCSSHVEIGLVIALIIYRHATALILRR